MYMIMSCNLPVVSNLIWRISLGPERGSVAGVDYVVWLLRLILHWLQPSLAIFFSLEFSVRLWKLKSILKIPRSLLALLLSPLQSIGAGCIFASMELAVRFSDETSLLPLLPFFLAFFVDVILHVC